MGRKRSDEPQLSLERIISETIDFVDERGLEALTMRALASRLDVYPAALYWHVETKARLLSLAAAEIVGHLPSTAADEDWRTWLVQTAHDMRRAIHEHANFAPVLGGRIAVDASTAVPFIEAVLAALGRSGLGDAEIVDAYNAYVGLVMGWVSMELSTSPPSINAEREWQRGFADRIASLAIADYPNLFRLLPRLVNRSFMMRWESGRSNPLDSGFELAVTAFADGLAARAPQRNADPGTPEA